MIRAICLLGALAFVLPMAGQRIPAVHAEALDGSKVVLPRPDQSQVLLLVLGFSSKSSAAFESWDKYLAPAYRNNSRIAYYQLPVLEGVPHLLLGLIENGMRRKIPPASYARFAPLMTEKAAWKKVVDYSSPDAAYLVLADGFGNVVWQTHAPPTTAALAELRAAVTKLL